MGIGKTTRIRSIAEAHHAVFAAILVTPTQTTVSSTVRGRTIVILSIGVPNPVRPAPSAITITQTIPIPMANGQA